MPELEEDEDVDAPAEEDEALPPEEGDAEACYWLRQGMERDA